MTGGPVRLALARMRADRSLLLVAALLSFVATTLLVVGPVASDAIVEAVVQRRLADATSTRAGVEVSGQADIAANGGAIDAALDQLAGNSGPGASFDHLTVLRSGSLRFAPTLLEDAEGVVTTLASVQGFDEMLVWVDGRAPADGEAALHLDAAQALGLQVGGTIKTESALPALPLVGVFQPVDLTDPRWWGNGVVRDGVVTGESFQTIGPIVVTTSTLLQEDPTPAGLWRLYPLPSTVQLDDIERLRALPSSTTRALIDSELIANGRLTTDLENLLDGIDNSVAATRSVVTALLGLFTLLGLPALAIAGSLIADSRRVESALLLSRGADRSQLMLVGLFEGLLVSLAAGLFAIPSAFIILRAVNTVGPAAQADLGLAPRSSGATLLALTLGILLSLAVLTLPLHKLSNYSEARATRTRDDRPPWFRRNGIDVIAIVIASVALWQLQTTRAEASETLGFNSTLILAPSLALGAGALIALRSIRLVAQGALIGARPSSGLAASLVARRISRQPARSSRAALLVLLAVAIAGFALIHNATWQRSQQSQADADVGVDVIMTVDQSAGRLPDAVLGNTLIALDGISDASPALRSSAVLGSETVDLLLAESTDLGTVNRQPAKLAPSLVGGLDLLQQGPPAGGPILTGSVLAIDIASTLESDGGRDRIVELSLTIQDDDGLIHTLPFVTIPSDRARTVEVPLSAPAGPASVGFRLPARLLDIVLRVPSTRFSPDPEIGQGQASGIMSLTNWRVDGQPLEITFDSAAIRGSVPQPQGPASLNSEPLGDDRSGAEFRWSGGRSRGANASAEFLVTVLPADDDGMAPVPVLLTPALVASLEFDIGVTSVLAVGSTRIPVIVVGTVETVPTFSRSSRAVLADFGAVASAARIIGDRPPAPTDFLVSTDGGLRDGLTAELQRQPLSSPGVSARDERARQLRRDPVQVGVVIALSIGLVAAAASAIGGLVANAISDRRERANDDAVLRALGASPRSLRVMLILESVLIVGVSVVLGLFIAFALGALVLPSLAINDAGQVAVPEPSMVVPWARLALVAAAAVAALLFVPVLVEQSLRRQETATALRIGEGR